MNIDVIGLEKQKSNDCLIAAKTFPYFIFGSFIKGDKGNIYRNEVYELIQYFLDYQCGADFKPEGSKGDYIPSNYKFKKIKTLIDKEARFMFSQQPEIKVKARLTDDKSLQDVEYLQTVVNEVLKNSGFSNLLLQSAKDCFIAKRIAALVDYSEEDGIAIHFYNSLQFYYEYQYGTNKLIKFVSFECVEQDVTVGGSLYLVNEYTVRSGAVYMSSAIYKGSGVLSEQLIEEHRTDLKQIPVAIIINDGTLMNKRGMSEVRQLAEGEATYSKLANADVDCVRKGMNPIRYTVDMSRETTKNLSSSAGSYWDLEHNMNLDEPTPMIGTLSPDMGHTEALKNTLDRINSEMYNELDIPNISEETLVGTITSGKSIKALYYSLMVRCDEKFKTWKPAIENIIKFVLEIVLLNKDITKTIYEIPQLNDVEYDIVINEKYALLDDELEEKSSDMEEVQNNLRSVKSYLKKHRHEDLITDQQIDEEILQIVYEKSMFDGAIANPVLEDKTQEDVEDIEINKQVEEEEINKKFEE